MTKCFSDRGFAFILGEDNNSYFLHYSKLNGEHIEKGYYVFFVPFQNERSDYNVSRITVINAPEKATLKKVTDKKKEHHKKHKSCNADKVIRDDRKFQKFIKSFIYEQKHRESKNIGKDIAEEVYIGIKR